VIDSIPRLGIPGIDMSDAAYGVRSSGENGRYATALPANVGAAASWDVDAAYEYGKLIGTELMFRARLVEGGTAQVGIYRAEPR
jgi:beta-glucosidase-like glycosyl hydrolase